MCTRGLYVQLFPEHNMNDMRIIQQITLWHTGSVQPLSGPEWHCRDPGEGDGRHTYQPNCMDFICELHDVGVDVTSGRLLASWMRRELRFTRLPNWWEPFGPLIDIYIGSHIGIVDLVSCGYTADLRGEWCVLLLPRERFLANAESFGVRRCHSAQQCLNFRASL